MSALPCKPWPRHWPPEDCSTEFWATWLREKLAVQGVATDPDTWKVVALLQRAGLLDVRLSRRSSAFIGVDTDGTYLVTIPDRWPEERKAAVMLEEVGHLLTLPRRPIPLPPAWCPRPLSLWKRSEIRDEAEARRFVLAWKLPSDLLLDYLGREGELLALTRCAPADLTERLRAFE